MNSQHTTRHYPSCRLYCQVIILGRNGNIESHVSDFKLVVIAADVSGPAEGDRSLDHTDLDLYIN